MNPIEVRSDFADSSMRLTTGVLVYEGSGTGKAFATVHSVEIDDQGAPCLLAGTPITRETLMALNEKLVPEAAFDYVPLQALAAGAGWMVWWREAEVRSLFFDTDREDPIGKQVVKAHLPALVFAARNGELFVFALAKSERPVPETALAVGPFYNTWADGHLCQGSARRPDRHGFDAITQFESMFYDSTFTHPNDGKLVVRHRKGVGGLWNEIATGMHETFPVKHLKPAGVTLGDLVKKLKQKGEH